MTDDPMTPEVKAAYERGLQAGHAEAMRASIDRAHERIDRHDTRLTATERVMYAGMGVVFLIQALPTLAKFYGG